MLKDEDVWGTTRTTDVTQDELFVSGSEFRFTSGPLTQGASPANLVMCRPVTRCSWGGPEVGFYSGRAESLVGICPSTRLSADEKPFATPPSARQQRNPLGPCGRRHQ